MMISQDFKDSTIIEWIFLIELHRCRKKMIQDWVILIKFGISFKSKQVITNTFHSQKEDFN